MNGKSAKIRSATNVLRMKCWCAPREGKMDFLKGQIFQQRTESFLGIKYE